MFTRFLYYWRVFRFMFVLNLKTILEYKSDILIAIFSATPSQLVELLFIWVLFQNIPSLGGFSFYEMVLIYGFARASAGLGKTITDHFYEMPREFVLKGTLDTLIVQPLHTLFNLPMRRFDFTSLGSLLVGIILITISLLNLDINLFWYQYFCLPFFILAGGLIYFFVLAIATSSTFWIIHSIDVIWNMEILHDFIAYPLSVYHPLIRVFFVCLVPYAFNSYFPVAYLLAKPDGFYIYFLPVVLFILGTLALWIWNRGLKAYTSTGS